MSQQCREIVPQDESGMLCHVASPVNKHEGTFLKDQRIQ
jgi:hypothetical protein